MTGILWGIWSSGGGTLSSNQATETQLTKRPPIANPIGFSWYNHARPSAGVSAFDPNVGYAYIAGTSVGTKIADAHGRKQIAMIDWFLQNGALGRTDPDQTNFTLRSIYEQKKHDAYLIRFFDECKAIGHPIFMRMWAEFNGNWWQTEHEGYTTFPQATIGGVVVSSAPANKGYGTGDFIAAWRYVVNICRARKAKNVTWVWCPNICAPLGSGASTARPLSETYPGDAYVDWAMPDGYNWGNSTGKTQPWMSIDQVFRGQNGIAAAGSAAGAGNGWQRDTWTEMAGLAGKTVAMGVAETGSHTGPGDKAAWITDYLNVSMWQSPGLGTRPSSAAMYFSFPDTPGNTTIGDWPLASPADLSAQTAWRNAINTGPHAAEYLNVATATGWVVPTGNYRVYPYSSAQPGITVIAPSSRSITDTATTIDWSTDRFGSRQAHYRVLGSGTWIDQPTTGPAVDVDGDLIFALDHQTSFTGLTANTTYEYEMLSASPWSYPNRLGTSGIFTFKTAAQAGAPPPVTDALIDFTKTLTGLEAYWVQGEASGTNANDETANNRDGTYNGTPTLGLAGPPGSINTAAQYGALTKFMSAASNVVYNVHTGTAARSLAVRTYVYESAVPTGNGTIVGVGDGLAGGNYQWEMRRGTIDQRPINLLIYTPGGGTYLTYNPNLPNTAPWTYNAWHEVWFYWDGTTLHLYVDGVEIGTGATTGVGTLGSSTSPLNIGRRPDNVNPYAGRTAHTAVCSTLPTAAQITQSAAIGLSDTVPPVISGVSVSAITTTSATVSWTTSEPTDAQVGYGLSAPINSPPDYEQQSAVADAVTLATSHSIGLTGLSPGTLYHYGAFSNDSGGNLAFSADATFSTTAGTLTIGAPSVTAVSSSTVSLAWAPASGGVQPITYKVQRAPDVAGSPGTFTDISAQLANAVSFTAAGLNSATKYWFRVVVTDAATPTPTTATSSSVSATTTTLSIVVTNQPTVICELSLSAPTQAPEWIDITPYLKSFQCRRGRSFELDRFEAGTAVCVFDNTDGRFNPFNSAGPYFGRLKRMRRIRIRSVWSSATYPIFSGFVERWPYAILGVDNAESQVPLVDGFAILAKTVLDGNYPQQRTDQRIDQVLTDAMWTTGQAAILGDATYGVLGVTTVLGPVGDRQLSLGQSIVPEVSLSKANALDHLQQVNTTEDGWIFIAAGGALTFYGRNRRLSQGGKGTMAVFGDRPDQGELMYVSVDLTDDTPIYNRVTVSREGGSDQIAESSTSERDYFQTNLSLTILAIDDSVTLSTAQYYLARYDDPLAYRVASLTLDGSGDPGRLWPQILGREIADPITVRVRPPTTTPIFQDLWIEGIAQQWDAVGGDWLTQWSLSPIDPTGYAILGASILGQTTRLGYI